MRSAAERAHAARVALRPHAKTHKSPEIARLQVASGAVGLTVATLGEAEVFVQHGCRDVFIAYPLWLEPDAVRRLRDLAQRATVAFGVDSTASAARAGRFLAGSGVEVLVEVDSGQHRTGSSPEDAGRIAANAARAGIGVRGVFTFPGHSYSPETRISAAQDESVALAKARDSLIAEGLEVAVVSGGSTPSLWSTDTEVVNELRPGVYVFGDAQQWELGAMEHSDLALSVVARVVSHAGGHAVLDAGSKALGADRAPYATGYGRLLDHPEARIVALCEHHAVIDMMGPPPPSLGETVRVVPNHVCWTVNLAEELWVEEHGTLRPWPVAARGRNS